jgi:hypothetical protein
LAPEVSVSDYLLPEGARLVHIGPHKTGSTAIQVALKEAAEEMASYGVYFPQGPYRRRKAGWSLGLAGRPSGTPAPPIELWEALAAEIASVRDQRAVISNEDFGRATPEQARRIVADLGGEAAHVVAVVRRLDRYLPSQWQERVKAHDDRPFEEWLKVVLHGDARDWEYRNVWDAHDVVSLARRWVDVVGPDRFTLLISDDEDHDAIPRAFEALLGLPAGLLKQPVSDRSNRSLNLVEAELVRLLNGIVYPRGVRGPLFRRVMKEGVITALVESPGALPGPKIPLPEWALNEIRELSDQRADAVAAMGVRVIGDPDRLRVPPDVVAGDPDASQVQAPLSAVVEAIGATLVKMIERMDMHAEPR